MSLLPVQTCVWNYQDEHGIVMPWYTKPMLDVLVTWPLKDWRVFEFGGGYSTLWYATRCREVVMVDNLPDWVEAIKVVAPPNVTALCRTDENSYVDAINTGEEKFDLIVIDGGWRDKCPERAMRRIKPGGYVILDNAESASHLDPAMKAFYYNEHHSYPMPRHPAWRTDYWRITVFDRWDGLNQELANRMEEARLGRKTA